MERTAETALNKTRSRTQKKTHPINGQKKKHAPGAKSANARKRRLEGEGEDEVANRSCIQLRRGGERERERAPVGPTNLGRREVGRGGVSGPIPASGVPRGGRRRVGAWWGVEREGRGGNEGGERLAREEEVVVGKRERLIENNFRLI
jgi:hypothetical protein